VIVKLSLIDAAVAVAHESPVITSVGPLGVMLPGCIDVSEADVLLLPLSVPVWKTDEVAIPLQHETVSVPPMPVPVAVNVWLELTVATEAV